MRNLLGFCLFFLITFSSANKVFAISPDVFVQSTVNRASEILSKDFSKEEISNLKKAYKIFFREGLKVNEALEKIKSECIQNDSIKIFIQSIEDSTRGVLR